ncbi:MAG: tRNA (N(6)-L-threonylcarbamoyladenosine(37)-C(2))-methylthiotransferase MtaB [Oscillospiraceae bacterium]
MKYAVYTLGCKVNSCESAAIASAFDTKGFEQCQQGEIADIFVINSCAVTSMSVKKARQLVSKCRNENKNAVIVLCGCFPQAYPNEAVTVVGADIICGTGGKAEICDKVLEFIENKRRIHNVEKPPRDFEEASAAADIDRTRAFIKIEDGCDSFCTYCIIPTARGRVRSRGVDEIARQAKLCAESGHKEIVLTGINLACYGREFGKTLGDAVLAAQADGIERIRLGSLEPELITQSEVNKLKLSDRLCPHFHLSLQSGCDNTLARMKRKYNTAQFTEAVSRLREAFPGCSITTDVIVGFPGETDEDFLQSLDFVEKTGFAKVNVFPYSIRKGTVAAEMDNQVVPYIKTERVKTMTTLSKVLEQRFFENQIGTVQSVLIEKRTNPEYVNGFTAGYIPVRIYGENIERHLIVNVKITDFTDICCIGELVK